MATPQILIKGGSNVVDLKKFRNKLVPKGDPDEYPEDADVTLVNLKDGADAVIVGSTDLPMNYVAGTTGKKTTYRALLAEDLPLVLGNCTANILAEAAGGVRPFEIACKVVKG